MPQTDDNIAAVQGWYAMFGRGDIAGIIDNCAPDVRWESVGDRVSYPLLGEWNGREGVRTFFAKLAETQEFSEFTPKEFYASGDHVFVIGHYEFTVRKTGRHTGMDWVHIFTVSDGKCASFREHTDTDRLAAAWRG